MHLQKIKSPDMPIYILQLKILNACRKSRALREKNLKVFLSVTKERITALWRKFLILNIFKLYADSQIIFPYVLTVFSNTTSSRSPILVHSISKRKNLNLDPKSWTTHVSVLTSWLNNLQSSLVQFGLLESWLILWVQLPQSTKACTQKWVLLWHNCWLNLTFLLD